MSLIVEDGTGLANAESFISVADADTYHSAYGNPAGWSGATTNAKETALRLATEYMQHVYGARWLGVRTHETQALAWPRENVYDADDFLLDDDIVPQVVARACAVLALKSVGGDVFSPDIQPATSGIVKKTFKKVGPITSLKEYMDGQDQFIRYTKVDRMLNSLLASGASVERG